MSDDDNKTLYHYTDANGLKGILENQTLWATYYEFLNDTEELKLNREIIMRRLPKVKKDILDDTNHDLLSNFTISLDYLNEMLLGEGDRNGMDTFILSFCMKDDLLSQWRGYGKNGAYAIGFEIEKLIPLLKDEGKMYDLSMGRYGKVVYYNGKIVPDELEKLIDDLIRKIFICIEPSYDESPFGEAASLYVAIAPFIKNNGFEEESEHRIVYSGFSKLEKEGKVHKKPLNFVNRNGTLIPYIELFKEKQAEGFKLPIVDLVIGPSRDQDKRKKSIELLLIEKGFDPKIVRKSEIPFIGD